MKKQVGDRAAAGDASIEVMMPATGEFDPVQPVVDAVIAGDRPAFDELVRTQGDWVRAVIFGVLGDRDGLDDVAQQVWVTAWEGIGRLRDCRRWRPWLYRLARNAAVDAGRERTRRRRLSERGAADRAARSAAAVSGGDAMAKAERQAMIWRAIKGLPALYREPFVLRHAQGWGYRQIGEVMGMPVDTVETRLVRARRLLRDALKDKV